MTATHMSHPRVHPLDIRCRCGHPLWLHEPRCLALVRTTTQMQTSPCACRVGVVGRWIVSTNALIEAARSVWSLKVEPLEIGIEDGIVWATARGPLGPINGYALIPAEGHPWSAGVPTIDTGNGYEEWETERVLEVHGGITYGYSGPWIGFDCVHCWDVWDAEFDPHDITARVFTPSSMDRRWTPALVAEEAKNLARQIAAVGLAASQPNSSPAPVDTASVPGVGAQWPGSAPVSNSTEPGHPGGVA